MHVARHYDNNKKNKKKKQQKTKILFKLDNNHFKC